MILETYTKDDWLAKLKAKGCVMKHNYNMDAWLAADKHSNQIVSTTDLLSGSGRYKVCLHHKSVSKSSHRVPVVIFAFMDDEINLT